MKNGEETESKIFLHTADRETGSRKAENVHKLELCTKFIEAASQSLLKSLFVCETSFTMGSGLISIA